MGVDNHPTGVLYKSLSNEKNMNIYSSEESEYSECIMPAIWKVMIDYFQTVADDKEYCEPEIPECSDDEFGDGDDGYGDTWGGNNGTAAAAHGANGEGTNGTGINRDAGNGDAGNGDTGNGDAVEIVTPEAETPSANGAYETGNEEDPILITE